MKLAILFICISFAASSQDTIYTKSGETIIADVYSENSNEISYTVWGKNFPKTMNLSDVKRIGRRDQPKQSQFVPGELMVDNRPIPSDINYITLRGGIRAKSFYYKVDCGFAPTIGDLFFTVNGADVKFLSPMDAVRVLDKYNWEIVTINSYGATYLDYNTTVVEILLKRKQ